MDAAIRRREFLALACGVAAASPKATRAQDKLPVIGYLHVGSLAEDGKRREAFLRGLAETGFVEGRNVVIEYRWAEGHADRLDDLAADLVRRHVAVIATASSATLGAMAAKRATSTIPIVFATATDPIKLGLVASLSHPGGNATGATSLNASITAKRLQVVRELAPKAERFFTLVNPTSPLSAPFIASLEREVARFGGRVEVLTARGPEDLDAAFAGLPAGSDSAFLSCPDVQFYALRGQIVPLVTRRATPAVFEVPDYVEEGALASYGNDFADTVHISGVYVGRILKGEKPADLPVVQAEKFVLALNLKTAAALAIEIPNDLLAAADEVIE